MTGSPGAPGSAGDGPRPGAAPQVVQLRPRRLRLVCWVVAALVLAVSFVAAAGMRGYTGAGYGQFRSGDQAAMVALGALAALGVLALSRPRVRADARTVRVRNLIGGYELPWQAVRRVKFDGRARWASLELLDDEVVPVHALQAVDRQYAVAGVRALRAMHAAAVGPPPVD